MKLHGRYFGTKIMNFGYPGGSNDAWMEEKQIGVTDGYDACDVLPVL